MSDVRPCAVSDLDPAHIGDELLDSVRDRVRGDAPVDVHQLDKDLECILIDKAKAGSDILHRITNLKKHGGIRMYAEVYKWFTETSGLGLT